MAGLLAAHYFRPTRSVVVWERQKALPHNHEAVLRLRSNAIERITGIKLQEQSVRSGIISADRAFTEPNIRLANQYALKVGDTITDRSIWGVTGEKKRYIPPLDFIGLLADSVSITYNKPFGLAQAKAAKEDGVPVISTIPMPALMDILGWKPKPKFSWRPIWVIKVEIKTHASNVQQTIYYPNPNDPVYRATLGRSHLTIELIRQVDEATAGAYVKSVVEDFGLPLLAGQFFALPKVTRQEYGKIVPSDPELCRDFMYQTTLDYGIYALGRFATWRQLVLDDLVHDLEVIGSMIRAKTKYHQRRMQAIKEERAAQPEEADAEGR